MEALTERIKQFLAVSSGSGDGSGYGYGYGDGSGYGSGYGYGDGSGDGSGSGYGYGDGSGSGYGYGDGSGDGYGYGDGSGDGSGITIFCGLDVHMIDCVATVIKNVRGNVARGFIVNEDLTTTPCVVVKSGNLFAHGDTLKDAEYALQEKIFDTMDVDDKVEAFRERFEPGVKYPAKDFYDWHHKLTGSCEFGRNAFARDHGIDLDSDEFTVAEFVELTKDDYGGEIIRRICEEDDE